MNTPVGVNTKRIAGEAGDDVKVHMENLLERGFAVREKQVDALAPQT